MASIKAGNIQINYNDAGTGTVLLFLHGFPFDKSSWQPQLEYFQKTHRVIVPDLRGFGESTRDERIFSMDLFADDLIALLDNLEIENCILCGLSMGGYIALNAVTRFPDRFEGLVLADTQCNTDTEEGRKKRYETIEHISKNGMESFAAALEKNLFLDANHPWAKKIHSVILNTSPQTTMDALRAMAERKETCSQLEDISIPTLIICGKQDNVTPVEKSELMRDRITGSSFHIIDNAAHLSNLEQPDSFNAVFSGWLNTLQKTPKS